MAEEENIEETTQEEEKLEETGQDTPSQQTEDTPTEKAMESEEKESLVSPPELHKVKIDGKEYEVDIAELKKDYQLAKTSYARMAEAAQKNKDVTAILELFEKDPKAVLTQTFIKKAGDRGKGKEALRNFAVEVLQEFMAEDGLSEEERVVKAKEEEVKEKERLLREKENQIEKEKEEALAEYYEKEMDREIPEALKKVGLPDVKAIRAHMYEGWRFLDALGAEPSFDNIAIEVKKQRRASSIELAKTLSNDEFRKCFPEQYEACRKEDLDELRKTSTSQTSTPIRDEDKTGRERPEKFNSMAEFSRWKEAQLEREAI